MAPSVREPRALSASLLYGVTGGRLDGTRMRQPHSVCALAPHPLHDYEVAQARNADARQHARGGGVPGGNGALVSIT